MTTWQSYTERLCTLPRTAMPPDLSQNAKIRTPTLLRCAAMCCDGQDTPDSAFDDILFQLRFSLGLIYTAKLNYCWNIWLKIVAEARVVDGSMMVCAFHLAPVRATAGTGEARQLVLEDVAQLRLQKQGHLWLCIIKGHLFCCAICILPQPVNHL